jgi:myosin heavy subunit
MANNTKRTMYLIIIFLLLLTNIVAGYFWLNTNKDVEKLTVEKVELRTEYNSLQKDLNTQMAELDAMKGQNTELDAIILEREKEIKDQQLKITQLFKQKNFTASEYKKAKAMISTLEIQNTSFMNQIDSLQTVTAKLRIEKDELKTDLTTQQETNSELEDKNNYLDGKVELGSLLRADELNITGIKVRSNGVEKEMTRIKKIDKIKVCYQTGNNLVREPGAAKMHLIIVTPKGETIYNEANGSGIFKNKDNEEIRYTKVANLDFKGKNKNVCIYWTQELLDAGEYKALMYNDGYLVGESTVEFK